MCAFALEEWRTRVFRSLAASEMTYLFEIIAAYERRFTYHTETIAGTEIQKPWPKKLHAIIQIYLLILLKSTLPEEYRVLPELNVICSGDRIVPDLTVYANATENGRGAKFDDGDLVDAPLLAVEIASPGQTFSDLLSNGTAGEGWDRDDMDHLARETPLTPA